MLTDFRSRWWLQHRGGLGGTGPMLRPARRPSVHAAPSSSGRPRSRPPDHLREQAGQPEREWNLAAVHHRRLLRIPCLCASRSESAPMPVRLTQREEVAWSYLAPSRLAWPLWAPSRLPSRLCTAFGRVSRDSYWQPMAAVAAWFAAGPGGAALCLTLADIDPRAPISSPTGGARGLIRNPPLQWLRFASGGSMGQSTSGRGNSYRASRRRGPVGC